MLLSSRIIIDLWCVLVCVCVRARARARVGVGLGVGVGGCVRVLWVGGCVGASLSAKHGCWATQVSDLGADDARRQRACCFTAALLLLYCCMTPALLLL
jgi:hypothetical protein